MTTTTTWSIDGTTTPATIARRMLAGLVGSSGTDADDALPVSERAASANNSWDVAAGGVFIRNADGEVWHAWWDDTNIPATAADPDNPRIDLIVAELRADGVNDNAILRVVTGDPAAAPVEPAAPDDSVVLARADVPNNVGSMVDAYLTDRREPARFSRALRDDGPRGVLGYVEITANQIGFVDSGSEPIPGLSVTVDVAANRKIRIKGFVYMRAGDTSGGDFARIQIEEGGVLKAYGPSAELSGTISQIVWAERILTPTEGEHTYQVDASLDLGATAADIRADATFPSFLLVEDIGPA